MIDQGNLIDSPQQVIQNWVMIVLGFLQSGKVRLPAHDQSGKPDKTSWNAVQQVRPHHGETLLDGNAQSVRYGETLRDRSGQLDNINSQAVANSQNFIMGSDTTELELSVESRSIHETGE